MSSFPNAVSPNGEYILFYRVENLLNDKNLFCEEDGMGYIPRIQ